MVMPFSCDCGRFLCGSLQQNPWLQSKLAGPREVPRRIHLVDVSAPHVQYNQRGD